jgi:hypothetical protein
MKCAVVSGQVSYERRKTGQQNQPEKGICAWWASDQGITDMGRTMFVAGERRSELRFA